MAILAVLAAFPSVTSADSAQADLLSIFGNANMDDKINEADATYVHGIIVGKNTVTKLADANYDGKIDALDVERINEIIKGDE
ncbi:MAG: ABC transporter substrate-binding protein, partial [Methanothrix sp.]